MFVSWPVYCTSHVYRAQCMFLWFLLMLTRYIVLKSLFWRLTCTRTACTTGLARGVTQGGHLLSRAVSLCIVDNISTLQSGTEPMPHHPWRSLLLICYSRSLQGLSEVFETGCGRFSGFVGVQWEGYRTQDIPAPSPCVYADYRAGNQVRAALMLNSIRFNVTLHETPLSFVCSTRL